MPELLQGQESKPRGHAEPTCGLEWFQQPFHLFPPPRTERACYTTATATKKPPRLFGTPKCPKQSVYMCFPDSVHVELCFLFIKNVKRYSKMEPPGPQLLWSPPLWAAICLGCPEASPLAMRAQSPLTPKHSGEEHLLGCLTEGCRSLGKFSSYLPGLGLG